MGIAEADEASAKLQALTENFAAQRQAAPRGEVPAGLSNVENCDDMGGEAFFRAYIDAVLIAVCIAV